MKALIFGSGQVAHALRASAPAGTVAVLVDRKEADLERPEALIRAIAQHRPCTIINAAAFTAVDHAEIDGDRAHRVNGFAPGIMAEAAACSEASFIHFSSDYVFDGDRGQPWMPADPLRPLNAYGASKAAGEAASLSANPRSLIIRTAWIYSAMPGNFATAMLMRLACGQALRVVDDQIGTPTWSRSLASATWDLVSARSTGVHHYTDAGVASWYDFACAIAEEALTLGLLEAEADISPIRSSEYTQTASRPAYGVLDKHDTWAILGRKPEHWRRNVRRCLEEIAASTRVVAQQLVP